MSISPDHKLIFLNIEVKNELTKARAYGNTLLEDQGFQTDSLNKFIIRKFWINTPTLQKNNSVGINKNGVNAKTIKYSKKKKIYKKRFGNT